MTPARELYRDEVVASWGADEPTSDLRFVAASEALRARGIHGWVFGSFCGVQLDGLRVTRTNEGYVAELAEPAMYAPVPGGSLFSDHDLGALVIDELLRREVLS